MAKGTIIIFNLATTPDKYFMIDCFDSHQSKLYISKVTAIIDFGCFKNFINYFIVLIDLLDFIC